MFITSAKEVMFLPVSTCWSVALSAGLHKNYGTDLSELERLMGLSLEQILFTFGVDPGKGIQEFVLTLFNIVSIFFF